ncbi:MAG TPA: cold-shock protein [Candidatus Dormibacteraeota bacterium]|nr:cold-shock protein [Candidatus Dormibacteraeota bacterium]
MTFGTVKSYNAERRIGYIEQTLGPDVPFILGEGESAPEVGQRVSFQLVGRAVNIRVESDAAAQ